MVLSGSVIGWIGVGGLLIASLLIAFLDKKEKGKGNLEKSRFLSRLALGLFFTAFIGGVTVTLISGIHPREDSMGMIRGRAGSPPDSSAPSGFASGERMTGIGKIDEQELKRLQEKVATDSKDVKSRERLGHLYLQMQDYENVFAMSHEALQVNPRSAESRVHMGMVLSAMGEQEQAMAQFDQALKDDPKNLEALLFKGINQYQGDDLKGAKQTWERFMKIAKPTDTGYERVQMFLANINELLAETK